jgi:glycosyltransferase involved in cell wall biosynthesis
VAFISFIVGFRNRETKRVKLFLDSLAQQSDKDFELIFVDYGSDEEAASQAKELVGTYIFAKYFFHDTKGQNWNRGKCLNYAFSHTGSDNIFTADIDFLFHPSFIKTCRQLAEEKKAWYFRVGFLDRAQPTVPVHQLPSLKIKHFSDENAIGPLLISKEMFTELGGYDEFFEIWGLEDNDLLFRIKSSRHSISYYPQPVLIWHMWHPPAKESNILPEGWLKFLGDYFDHKKSTANASNFYCKIDPGRPVLNERGSHAIKSRTIGYSRDFLHYFLVSETEQLGHNEILELRLDFKPFHETMLSRLNRLVQRANNLFRKGKLPITISNTNMRSYLSEQDARDTIQYFLKDRAAIIRDYYLPADLSSESFYLMKR